MPILLDYLLAPWKILGLLGGDTPKPLSAGGASGLCFTIVSDGPTLSTCQAFGYSMPGFIFWASLLILALFVASSAALAVQCLSLAISLGRVAEALERLRLPAGQKLTVTTLDAITEAMRREPGIARFWTSYEETLLKPADGGEVFATRPVEEALDRARVVEHYVDTSYFSSVPGVLTGVGLLMTFVAILDGLSHVAVSATMDVTGIGGLINGLSGKFVSSVTAVSCAVLFVFVERLAYSRPFRAYEAVLAQLRGRFHRRTTEQLLAEILAAQHRLAEQAARPAERR